MILYFSYGSNMDPNRMRHRCPQAVALGAASLSGYTLDFTHTSRKNGGSVANIVPCENRVVWGVVWTLAENFWKKLCAKEGYDSQRNNRFNTYLPKELFVILSSQNGPLSTAAWTFVVNEVDLSPWPTQRYMRYILEGAVAHRLPMEYYHQLRQYTTID